MKIIHFLIAGILMAISNSIYAQPNLNQKDSSIIYTAKNTNIYKLILAGRESDIKNHFRIVSFDELTKSDSGAIGKAFKRLNTNDKVTRTIWILEEVKNRNIEIRAYVYNELIKIDFGKPSFFLNRMINNYFTNCPENEVSLAEKVRKLHGKMNR